MREIRIGTAGWMLPRDVRDAFPGDGSQLERYARTFAGVEINSTFYRPHRRSTYERWARSVPPSFRFALKVPKEITHARRLVACDDLLACFLDESAALGEKRDVMLVQLPPSFAYDPAVVEPFLIALREQYAGSVACEPRHASWFTPAAEHVLRTHRIARVAADPLPPGALDGPGGASTLRYWRLHGSPVVYRSSYDENRLASIVAALTEGSAPTWCIFDNTTFGAATANALSVQAAVEQAARRGSRRARS